MHDAGNVSIPVPETLRPWITDVLTSTPTQAGGPHAIRVPDHATTLVLTTLDDGTGGLAVAGPQTSARYIVGPGASTCLHLRLSPGRARRLLGFRPGSLVDRTVSLTSLWGVPAGAFPAHHADALSVLSELLLDRVATGPPGDSSDIVVAAATAMSGRHRLPDIARRVGVSERHLRDLFRAEVGLAPKQYVRIDRLRRVLAAAGRRPWAELAQDAGYYDQSHLIADFGELMGVPPGAYVAGRLPTPSPCPSTAPVRA